MSVTNKAKNTADKSKGKAKTAAGRLTGDKGLENRGRAGQAKASLKQAGEKVKDAAGSTTKKK